MADNLEQVNAENIKNTEHATQTATTSAAESLVFLMDMLQNFGRTMREVTTNPGFTGEAYRRLASSYQHHLNPQLTEYLNKMKESNMLGDKEIATIQKQNRVYGDRARQIALVGGALSGMAFRLANVQEGLEKLSATNLGLPGFTNSIDGGSGTGGKWGMGAGQGGSNAFAVEQNYLRNKVLRDQGSAAAGLVDQYFPGMNPMFTQMGMTGLGQQRTATEYFTGMASSTQYGNMGRDAQEYYSKYKVHGKGLNEFMAMQGSTYENFREGGNLAKMGMSYPEVMDAIKESVKNLEQNSSGTILQDASAYDIVGQLFNAMGSAGLGGKNASEYVDFVRDAVDHKSEASRMFNAQRYGGSLIENQNSARRELETDPLKFAQDYGKFVMDRFEKVVGKDGNVNLVSSARAEGFTGRTTAEMQNLYKVIEAMSGKATDASKNLSDASNAFGYFNESTGAFSYAFPEEIAGALDNAADAHEVVKSYVDDLTTAIGTSLPKELSYAIGGGTTALTAGIAAKLMLGKNSGLGIAKWLMFDSARQLFSSEQNAGAPGQPGGSPDMLETILTAGMLKQAMARPGIKNTSLPMGQQLHARMNNKYVKGASAVAGLGIAGYNAYDLAANWGEKSAGDRVTDMLEGLGGVGMMSGNPILMGGGALLNASVGIANQLSKPEEEVFIDKVGAGYASFGADESKMLHRQDGQSAWEFLEGLKVKYDKRKTPRELAEKYDEFNAQFNTMADYTSSRGNYYNDVIKSGTSHLYTNKELSNVADSHFAMQKDAQLGTIQESYLKKVSEEQEAATANDSKLTVQFVNSKGESIAQEAVIKGGDNQLIRIMASDVREVG